MTVCENCGFSFENLGRPRIRNYCSSICRGKIYQKEKRIKSLRKLVETKNPIMDNFKLKTFKDAGFFVEIREKEISDL